MNKSPYLNKVGMLGVPDSDHGMHFLDQLLFLVVIKLHVPFGQPRLPCSVLNEDEADLYEEKDNRKINISKATTKIEKLSP